MRIFFKEKVPRNIMTAKNSGLWYDKEINPHNENLSHSECIFLKDN